MGRVLVYMTEIFDTSVLLKSWLQAFEFSIEGKITVSGLEATIILSPEELKTALEDKTWRVQGKKVKRIADLRFLKFLITRFSAHRVKITLPSETQENRIRRVLAQLIPAEEIIDLAVMPTVAYLHLASDTSKAKLLQVKKITVPGDGQIPKVEETKQKSEQTPIIPTPEPSKAEEETEQTSATKAAKPSTQLLPLTLLIMLDVAAKSKKAYAPFKVVQLSVGSADYLEVSQALEKAGVAYQFVTVRDKKAYVELLNEEAFKKLMNMTFYFGSLKVLIDCTILEV